MQTLYITHPECHLHEMGPWHPEAPGRLDAINDHLISGGLLDLLAQVQAVPASDADLLRVHTPAHLAHIQMRAPKSGYVELDADTVMNARTMAAARAAAGAGITAVDQIMATHSRTAFCAVRPPGHHASSDQAMGFCFFNNIAVTAAYTLEKYKLDRVAIIDFDVHHGNGTEEIFAGNPKVLMCGFFQYPLFPNVHTVNQAENMVNIPLDAYADGSVARKVLSTVWMPRLEAFNPQFIFISAGFDAHCDDELGQLQLHEADYLWMTQQLVDLADRTAGGRVVSFLEGGYSLPALGRSVLAHIRALAKVS